MGVCCECLGAIMVLEAILILVIKLPAVSTHGMVQQWPLYCIILIHAGVPHSPEDCWIKWTLCCVHWEVFIGRVLIDWLDLTDHRGAGGAADPLGTMSGAASYQGTAVTSVWAGGWSSDWGGTQVARATGSHLLANTRNKLHSEWNNKHNICLFLYRMH